MQETSLNHCLPLCLSGMLEDYPPMEGREILHHEDKNFEHVCTCVCVRVSSRKHTSHALFCTGSPSSNTLNMFDI